MTKGKLRTKTGCFTCRARRVKCKEQRPCCSNCSIRGLECVWPQAPDLLDRRHRQVKDHVQSDRRPANAQISSVTKNSASDCDSNSESSRAIVVASQYPPIRRLFRSDIELILFHHFSDKFLVNLLLPNAHPGFFNEYLAHCANLALNFDSVRCSLMACSALNKYMITNEARFREASLVYYSRAVKEVNRRLHTNDLAHTTPDDATLTSIIWLYIHSLWGMDTTEDAHKHVKGAVQIMTLRYSQSSNPMSMARAADRVTAESVLYQSFLLSIRHPFRADFSVDPEFLVQSESVLESMTYLDASPSANSPVLGLPLQFYRLICSVIQFCSSPTHSDSDAAFRMKSEMTVWEAAVTEFQLADSVTLMGKDDLHYITIALYVLAASLLLDLVLDSPNGQPIKLANLPRSRARWQLRKAMRIVQHPAVMEQWTQCFISNWPLQILGYAATDEEDVIVIRKALHNMRESMGYGEIERIIEELESIWQQEHIVKVENTERSGVYEISSTCPDTPEANSIPYLPVR